LTQCLILADNLSKNFPAFKYIKVLKHPEEWETYAEDICNLFGFNRNAHPLIFYSYGNLIGGRDEFFSYITKNYGLELALENKIVYNLTQENTMNVNREYEIVNIYLL
jgi:hypothetical protein